MKRRLVIVVIATLVLLSTLACSFAGWRAVVGSGRLEEETRIVSNVHSINLIGSGKLYIEVGEREKLVIEADDNLLQYIDSDVSGSELTLGPRSSVNLRPRRPINYYLTVVDLKKIEVAGSGDVDAPTLEADEFQVRILGSGDVEIKKLSANTLETDIGGSGDITIDGGRVQSQDVNISGSGNYRAEDLDSDDARIVIGGSGNATLTVQENLDVRILGSGNVKYTGDPRIDSHITGSGTVRQVDH